MTTPRRRWVLYSELVLAAGGWAVAIATAVTVVLDRTPPDYLWLVAILSGMAAGTTTVCAAITWLMPDLYDTWRNGVEYGVSRAQRRYGVAAALPQQRSAHLRAVPSP